MQIYLHRKLTFKLRFNKSLNKDCSNKRQRLSKNNQLNNKTKQNKKRIKEKRKKLKTKRKNLIRLKEIPKSTKKDQVMSARF